jgi:hypothetical protein
MGGCNRVRKGSLASELREAVSGGVRTWVDEWVYDLGRGTFPRFLRFENGVLVRIEVLSRPG